MAETPKARPRFYDLSDTLRNGTWEPLPHKIVYKSHEEGAAHAAKMFGLKPSDFPESRAWAVEEVTLHTHSGTHIDAPYHYGPNSGGKPARTIDQMPLDWFFNDGVVLDFSQKPAGGVIHIDDLQAALDKIDYTLKPFDIVLVRTDASKHFGEVNYQDMHAGVSAAGTRWLISQGIRVMGIDAWGWDRPFPQQTELFRQGEKDVLWEAHYVGKDQEYCQIERLANLDKLPRPFGFKVSVFPFKLEGCSGSWTRAVAIFDEG